jgi:DNA-binding LacI/PurR family transcriptional regulator
VSNASESTRRVTIADIAERAGVSIGAVSFALNGRKGVSAETRKRILTVADELGWAPASAARSLAEAKTATFGLVLARDPKNLGVESFYMQFLAGVESELSLRNYGLLLQVVPDVESELETLRAWRNARRVDGVILVDVRLDDPRVAYLAETPGLPTVVVGDPRVAGPLTSVWTDDASAAREAVRHLVQLGHRRIARISGLAELAHTHIRDEAFIDEMRALGRTPVLLDTDYTPEQGADVTRSALAAPDAPTALIFDNDIMAVAAIGVATQLGIRIPEELSIIAWDDSVLCRHTVPTLTALSHDVVNFGAHVARRLFEVIDGAEREAFLDSTPELQVRGSTGPAPADA